MKNETSLIANSNKRHLTAKGSKFLNKVIVYAAEQRGLTRYHTEMKPIREKLKIMIEHLIIDKRLDESEIKEIIKNSVNSKKEII